MINGLEKLKNCVIIDIDNFKNEHLNDPVFIKYVIDFSEKGGASGFLSKSITNLNILKKQTSLPIFAQIEENFNDILITKTYEDIKNIVELKPNFIVLDMSVFEDDYEVLESLIKELRINFDGELISRVSTKEQALEAYKFEIDAIIVDVFGECFNESIVFEISSDINIPIIVSLNSVDFQQARELVNKGMNTFILGEDVTNPNKSVKQYNRNRNYTFV